MYEPFLAQGLMGAGKAVSDGISKQLEEKKRMALQAALLGAGMPPQLSGQDIAMNPDEYNVMGNPRQMQGIAGLGQVG